MTPMNTQESVFKKVQLEQISTAHLANVKCFQKHHKPLLFSIVVEKKKSQTGDLVLILERVKRLVWIWGF